MLRAARPTGLGRRALRALPQRRKMEHALGGWIHEDLLLVRVSSQFVPLRHVPGVGMTGKSTGDLHVVTSEFRDTMAIDRNRMEEMKLVKRYNNKNVHGSIFRADALDLLRSLGTESSNLVFLDPPFNLGKRYVGVKQSDRRPAREYEAWLIKLIEESVRILRPGGALYVYHIPFWAMRIGFYAMDELEFRHWIAVAIKNGFARGKRLYPAHYALLYFTKGSPRSFSRPKLLPARCRHCNEVIKDYGGYLPIIKKKGLNLSDFWEDLSPVRHSRTKTRDSNELPSMLVDRVIAISGRRGSVFVDPFCGSGAAIVAAVDRGMTFIAGDISQTYANATAHRIGDIS